MADAFLEVEGMTCEGCAVGIQATLAKRVVVSSVTVHFEEKLAHVVYDPSGVSVEQIIESFAGLSGMRAEGQERRMPYEPAGRQYSIR